MQRIRKHGHFPAARPSIGKPQDLHRLTNTIYLISAFADRFQMDRVEYREVGKTQGRSLGSGIGHTERGSWIPRKMGEEKWLVVGRGQAGRVLQVIYLLDSDGSTAFVIHAMPVTTRRRRRRR